MANYYSDVATVTSTSRGIHERNVDSRLTSGDVKMLYATYTSTGAETASDLIYLARVKEGQLFLPWAGGFVYQNGIAATCAGIIGVEYDDDALTDDDNAFFANATIAGSTETRFTGELAITPSAMLGDGWIVFNPATMTTPAAGKIFVVALPWVQAL